MNLTFLNNITLYSNIIVTFIAFVLYVKNYNKFGKAYNIFTIYLGFIFLIQLGIKITFSNTVNNFIFANLFGSGAIVILSFLYLALLKSKMSRNIVVTGLIFFIIFTLLGYTQDISTLFKINVLGSFIVSFLPTIYYCLYLYEILNKHKIFYYVSIGGIIYNVSNIFIFLSSNFFLNHYPSLANTTYNLHNCLVIVYLIFVFLEWKINFSEKK
jgi:hypothetical protein